MIVNTIRSIKIFLKEKTDVVICTGVLAVIPICLLMKLFKKELIYIESFAKVTLPTKTGKLLYRYADQFYVQWESMKQFYPNAIYLGGICYLCVTVHVFSEETNCQHSMNVLHPLGYKKLA